MIDEAGSPLLVDFGKAKMLSCEEDDTTTTMEGTYMFLPPESCSFDSMSYSMKKADIWSLGLTIYILTFNKLPFNIGHTEIDIMDNICTFDLKFEERVISDELREMLEMFLQKDPCQRATLEELKNCRFVNMPQKEIKRVDSFKIGSTFEFRGFSCISACEAGDSPIKYNEYDHQVDLNLRNKEDAKMRDLSNPRTNQLSSIITQASSSPDCRHSQKFDIKMAADDDFFFS